MGTLSLLQWNANSVRQRYAELRNFLSVNRIDVVCIQESKLSSRYQFSMPGYNVVRRDNPSDTSSRGLLTLIRQGIPFQDTHYTGPLEAQIVPIHTSRGKVRIINLYLPPTEVIQEDDLNDLINGTNTIVVGDFNARSPRWGSQHTCSRGRFIENCIDRNDFVILNTGQPTHVAQRGVESHIDVSICSCRLAVSSRWEIVSDLMGSDHFPIVVRLNESPSFEQTTGPKWKLRNANWQHFADLLDEWVRDSDIRTDDVDEYNSRIVSAFLAAAEKSVPQTGKGRPRARPLPYWNDQIRRAIAARNRARNKLKRTQSLDDCIEYKRLKAEAQRTIRMEASTYWQQYCGTLDHRTPLSNIWKMVKRMQGVRADATSAPLKIDDVVLETMQDKAEAFAEQYAAVSSSSNFSSAFQKRKREFEQSLQQEPLVPVDRPEAVVLNDDFSMSELRQAIKSGKTNKSPGVDRVVREFLQNSPDSMLRVLLVFYNMIWSTGQIPVAWKHAIVLPILKNGKDRTAPSSYRPISLTSVLSKVMEKMTSNRLQWYMERYELFNSQQSGFRKGRSTTDHLLRLQDTVLKHTATGGHVLAVFLDVEKAFDMLWNDGLMMKLAQLGVAGKMFKWINNFVHDRTFQVRVGNTLSHNKVLENGTAQGAQISPSLFIVMNNDLVGLLPKGLCASLFADDLEYDAAGTNIPHLVRLVQKGLDITEVYCDTWGMRISSSKSVAVLFTRSKVQHDIKLTINGNEIPVVKSAKFLGMTFDDRLSWSTHVKDLAERCNKRINVMKAIAGNDWGAQQDTLLTIYRAIIRPVIDYGSIVYDSASRSLMSTIDSIQYRALKIVYGAMKGTALSALQVEAGEMPLNLRRHRLQCNYGIQAIQTKGHVARAVFTEHWQHSYGKFKGNGKPVFLKIREFLERQDIAGIRVERFSKNPPWTYPPIVVDLELGEAGPKKENAERLSSKAKEKTANYGTTCRIYTDASKDTNDNIGIGIVIQQPDKHDFLCFSYRLDNALSIHCGELVAIRTALEKALELDSQGKITLFTDSQSALACLQSSDSNTRQDIVDSIFCLLAKLNVTFVWIPSHLGVDGNELADSEANRGRTRPTIDITVGKNLEDGYKIAMDTALSIWQQQWTTSTVARHYHSIQPTIVVANRHMKLNRKKSSVINRLRFGICALNARLHKIGKADSPLCVTCGKDETIDHYLLECTGNPATLTLHERCEMWNLDKTVVSVLSDTRTLNFIASTFTRKI